MVASTYRLNRKRCKVTTLFINILINPSLENTSLLYNNFVSVAGPDHGSGAWCFFEPGIQDG